MESKKTRTREPRQGSGSAAKRATITDVATRANVSTATVSRALSGSYPVAPETRRRVAEAVSELGYVINAQARALAGARTRTVGIIIQDIADGFFALVARGVELEAAATGRLCLVCCTHGDPAQELAFIDLLREQRADAVILVGGAISEKRHSGEILKRGEALREQGSLLIHCGRSTPGDNISAVEYDNIGGAVAITDHLLTNGHRRILFLGGPPKLSTVVDRLAGHQQSLRQRGVPIDPTLIQTGQFGSQFGYRTMKKLLDDGLDATAVFAANDSTAYGAYQAMREAGVRIPEDMSIVGYDDLPASSLLYPGLTTVSIPLEEMGRRAVRMAVAHSQDYADEGLVTTGNVKLGTHVILRDSVAAPKA